MTVPLVACVVILLIGATGRVRLRRLPRGARAHLPWSVRNYAVNESWWPTQRLNLFLAACRQRRSSCPTTTSICSSRSDRRVVAEDMRGPNDDSPESTREIDRILTRRAISNFSTDPPRALQSRAWNLVHYFWPPLVPYYLEGPDTRVVEDPAGGIVVVNPVRRPHVEIVAYSILYTALLAAAIVGVAERRDACCDAMRS